MKHSVIMPEMGENILQGVVTQVAVAVGDEVEIGQALIEVEADKVILEVPAPASGVIRELFVGAGDKIKPGERFANISAVSAINRTSGKQRQEQVPEKLKTEDSEPLIERTKNSSSATPSATAVAAYAGPSAYRLARELGVSIGQVPGTAENGRISCTDIKMFVRSNQQQNRPQHTPLPDLSGVATLRREPLTGVARSAAENMARAWARIPHAWLQIRVDVTQLEKLRADKNLSLTVFLLKALAKTLKKFPEFNACYDEMSAELVIKQEVHIGLAVDTPRGLLVPVLKNVDRSALLPLGEQLQVLTETARQNRLNPEQLRGGGMTLSNLGGMGIDSLFPVVNWPEVAILGVGTTKVEPVWLQTQFIPRTMLNLVLGFDHRLINGADGARFLNHLKKLLESPCLLALQ